MLQFYEVHTTAAAADRIMMVVVMAVIWQIYVYVCTYNNQRCVLYTISHGSTSLTPRPLLSKALANASVGNLIAYS